MLDIVFYKVLIALEMLYLLVCMCQLACDAGEGVYTDSEITTISGGHPGHLYKAVLYGDTAKYCHPSVDVWSSVGLCAVYQLEQQ